MQTLTISSKGKCDSGSFISRNKYSYHQFEEDNQKLHILFNMWNARLLPDTSIMEKAQMHSGILSLNPIVNKQKHKDLFNFPE